MTTPPPTIEPSELSGYLASKGWRHDGTWRGAGVWSLEPSGQLLIPDRFEYQDDAELIQEAIHKLATYEDRTEQDLILDITEPMVDTQFFRTQPNTPSGTISLPSGVKVVQGVHHLIGTAARTAEGGPRPLFEGRMSSQVESLLHRVLLGAARPGSYVLTARMPVTGGQPPQLALFDELETSGGQDELNGREVILTLERATRAAWKAASLVTSAQARFEVFDEYIDEGVSANLCKALGELGGHTRDRPVDIGFTWARGLPGPDSGSPLSFSGSMVSVLAQAGTELENMAKSGEAQITGQVETLNLSPGEPPRIKVVGQVRAENQTITRRALWIIVSAAQYDEAITAQREGWPSKRPEG